MSPERPDPVAAEFLAAAVAVEALARLLPGEERSLARSWLAAVAQSIVQLSDDAPRVEQPRLRSVGAGTRAWQVGSVPHMRRNRGHL